MPRLWFERFNGYDIAELRDALDTHIDTSPRFPTVADLANLARPARSRREAAERRRADFVGEFEDKWNFVQVLAPDERLDRDVAWAYWLADESGWWSGLIAEAKSRNYEVAHETIVANGWALRP